VVDVGVFTGLIAVAPRPLLMRLASLGVATLVTWRLNRALTFARSGRHQGEEALRYAVVTAASQGTSYAVFAALVLTVFAALPQAAVLAGAVVGAVIGYNGHRLFAFAPPQARAPRVSR
jgi:putative flippase GtrA